MTIAIGSVKARQPGAFMRFALTAGVLLAGCKATGSRCLSLADEGRFPEAHACYQTALKSDPGNAEIWHNAGSLLAIDGRYAQAQRHFLKAVELNPDYAEAWYDLGLNYQNGLGQYEKALECLDRATRIKPDYLQAWKIKCSLLALSGGILSEGRFLPESAYPPGRNFMPNRTSFFLERSAQMEECREKIRELTRP